MTTTEEKVRAQERTEQLLRDLIDPGETPRVPKAVRIRARMCLRHLATPQDLEREGAANSYFMEKLAATIREKLENPEELKSPKI